jgi:hypothetical protein
MVMVVKMVKMGSIYVQLDYYLGFIGDSWIFFFFFFFFVFSITSFFGLDSSVKQLFHKFLYIPKETKLH